MPFKSGFIALIGAPNVGKSTLLNALLGQKISIVSSRPQTTRNRILGVKHVPGGQFIFLDTPGILEPKGLLNKSMVQISLKSIAEVNLIILMIEPFSVRPAISEDLRFRLIKAGRPVFLIFNKTDLIDKKNLLPLMEQATHILPFKEIIPISALTGEGLDVLEKCILQSLPEGPPYFPEDMVTDLSERFLVGEMIREKVFRLTSQEVPYGVAVTVETFKPREDKPIIHIRATIHVERDSQKGILIGKQGKMLKTIGQQARQDMETLLGNQVFLELWVRVEKNWGNDPNLLRRFGYGE
ncbi:MAG: GTPase Era [Deltaproteobacteria bacterium]|nr:GTPase Era [Deltaproteobacteria bacterium]